MKIVSINLGNYGSTGKIASSLKKISIDKNIDYILAYPENFLNKKQESDDIIICSLKLHKLYIWLGVKLGLAGILSVIPTFKFVNKLKKINPDILHLHNLHMAYLNIPILFHYIKKSEAKVVWTLHDCWSFTGRCAHFSFSGCDKWKTGCANCTYLSTYPQSQVDLSKYFFRKKRKWFSNIKDMTIVTPSIWLSELCKQSFLKNYNIKIINNGIDLNIYHPTASYFRSKYKIENKYIILGVSLGWDIKKGLDVYIDLAKKINVSKYQIVLVGTDDSVDKILPPNIISIHRTQDQIELAQIYSVADVFFNPTREDNYPTVNMEAIACGCPVITFNTGGSPEVITEKTGVVLKENTAEEAYKVITDICENHRFNRDDCIEHAKSFDMNYRFQEYINLYEKILKERN